MFLLDASTLITANSLYYPVDRVPEFWLWLEHHAASGVIKMPIEIMEEVTEGPDDGVRDRLYGWLTEGSVRASLVLGEESHQETVARVIREGYAADLSDTELEQVGRDPFLIAAALLSPDQRVVVTAEVSSPGKQRQKRKIPDVCKDMGVRCIDVFGLIRELDFRTSWRP